MKKIVRNYGLVAGGILALVMLITAPLWSSGKMSIEAGGWVGYISMIVALSTVFFGVRNYRDNEAGGAISFGKAFQVGLLITLVASIIYVAVWMIYSTYGSGSEFMDQYYQYSVEQLQKSGKSASEIEQEIAKLDQFSEMYKNPLVKIGFTFLEIFPIGLVISLLSAALLRKKSSTD